MEEKVTEKKILEQEVAAEVKEEEVECEDEDIVSMVLENVIGGYSRDDCLGDCCPEYCYGHVQPGDQKNKDCRDLYKPCEGYCRNDSCGGGASDKWSTPLDW